MSSRRTLLATATALAAALLVTAAIAFAPRTTDRLTDDRTIDVPGSDATPRDVLWTPAAPVAGGVNTAVDEYEPRIGADGTTMVLVRRRPGRNADLLAARWTPTGWSDPQPIDSVNTDRDELGPELSPDGLRLYFYSDRDGGVGGYDIWVAERASTESDWTSPRNLGPAINTPANEYGPALAPDGGHLWFASNRARSNEPADASAPAWQATLRERRARHDYDIYVSARVVGDAAATSTPETASDDGWATAHIVTALQTAFDDGSPAISPAGDFLYFASDRPGGAGGYDLYRVRLAPDGSIAAADGPPSIEPLGPAVNSSHNELDPGLASEGFRLYFSSDRPRSKADAPTSDARPTTTALRSGPFSPDGTTTSAPAELPHDAAPASAQPPAAADGADGSNEGGRYDLWFSTSREVRHAVAVERTDLAGLLLSWWNALWPWLLLLALLALLAWLLAALIHHHDSWRRRIGTMGLLARCLLASALLHLLLAALLAAWKVGGLVADRLQGGGHRVILASAPADTVEGDLANQILASIAPVELPRSVAPPVEMPAAAPSAIDPPAPTPVRPDPMVAVALPEPTHASESATAPEAPRSSDAPALAAAPSTDTARPEAPAARAADEATADRPSIAAPAVGGPTEVAAPADREAATTDDLVRADSIRAPLPTPSERADRDAPAAPGAAAPPAAALPASAMPTDAARPVAPASRTATESAPSAHALVDSALDAARSETSRSSPAPTPPSAVTDRPTSVAIDSIRPMSDGAAVPASSKRAATNDAAAALPERTAPPTSLPSAALSTDAPNVPRAATAPSSADEARAPAPSAMAPSSDASPAPLAAPSVPAAPVSAPAAPSATDLPRLAPAMPAQPASGAAAAELDRSSPTAPPPASLDATTIPASPTTLAVDARHPVAPAPLEQFEQRDPSKRDELLAENGGSDETEQAVGRALEWLKRRQRPDGRWSSRENEGTVDADAAMTGLALLTFLGAGHTHLETGPYQECVRRGIGWLVARTRPDGDLRADPLVPDPSGPNRSGSDRAKVGADTMYGQTIATVALCEAYAMTSDAELAATTRRAIEFVLARAADARRGHATASDTAVLGWLVMTIESARRAGFDPPGDVFASARAWLDSVTEPRHAGRYAYRPGEQPSPAMTAEAMFVQQLLGHRADERRMAESADFVLGTLPRWSSDAPTHHWYYATLALFQHQGEAWARWNEALTRELLAHQRGAESASDPEAGSWDPQDRWSRIGGRVYQTAICALSLEVYYRYRAPGDTSVTGRGRSGPRPRPE